MHGILLCQRHLSDEAPEVLAKEQVPCPPRRWMRWRLQLRGRRCALELDGRQVFDLTLEDADLSRLRLSLRGMKDATNDLRLDDVRIVVP